LRSSLEKNVETGGLLEKGRDKTTKSAGKKRSQKGGFRKNWFNRTKGQEVSLSKCRKTKGLLKVNHLAGSTVRNALKLAAQTEPRPLNGRQKRGELQRNYKLGELAKQINAQPGE